MSHSLSEKMSPVHGDVLWRKAVQLSARWKSLVDRKAMLETQLGQAKHRLSLQPQIQAVLDALQWRAHARGVGLYEQLLGSLIQDVMPQADKKVFVRLFTEKNLPALSIQLGVDENRLEDLWDGTGGSITNVISAGLRLIALARSQLRPFIMMDEPDCWLETSRVPRFAEVLSQLASEIGVQMVLITHHPMTHFESIPDRINLTLDSMGYIQAKNVSGLPAWTTEQKGIRSIRLEGVMSHVDTHLLLSPNVTILSGQNYIGKSAILTAMRAVSDGAGSDSMIRHGHDVARITYEMEEGKTLVYERVRKGTPKVIYTLRNAEGEVIHQERGERGSVPEWVHEHLGVHKLDDLDIQLHHQKTPVFLLDQPPSKQAAILSAGQESSHIQTMIRTYKERLAHDKAILRQGEKQLKLISDGLNKLEGDIILLGGAPDTLEASTQSLRAAAEMTRRGMDEEAQMEKYLFRLKQLESMSDVFKGLKNMTLSPVPQWDQTIIEMDSWLNRFHKSERIISLLSDAKTIRIKDVPVITDTDAYVKLGRAWVIAIKKVKTLNACKDLALPAIPVFDESVFPMSDWIVRQKKAESEKIHAKNEESKQRSVVDALLSDINVLLEMTGHACPACHQPVTTDLWLSSDHD
jgi:predicted ATPase